MQEFGKNSIGPNARIFDPLTLGFPSREHLDKDVYPGTSIGKNALLRSGGIFYSDVVIGDDFSSGHYVLIRERTRIGDRVAIGSYTIIEGEVTIGDDVRIQSGVFIPTNTRIGSQVFIGPHSVLTNDKYPPTGKPALEGPTIDDGAVIGANTTILPQIHLGTGSFVAAGAVVTRDVPPRTMAIGSPARIRPLPEELSH